MAGAKTPLNPKLAPTVAAYERDLIREAIQQTGGKGSRACRILGISRQTLYEKLSKHGLSLDDHRTRCPD